jgi:nucleoside-diphosphate-sugar epimerase
VNAVQPPYDRWAELFPPLMAAVLAGTERAGAKLVMVDNLYMYGPSDGELTEQTPRRATGKKGALRIRIEEQLMTAPARVAIGRLSDYYGTGGSNSSLVKTVLEPALKGRTMRWLGSLDQPRTLHYLDDAARGLLVLADNDRADGEVWHLPAAPPITGREFTALVNAHLERPVKVTTMSRLMLRIGGLFSAPARETAEVFYQWDRPFVSSHAKFEAAFGPILLTPHDDALRMFIGAAGP